MQQKRIHLIYCKTNEAEVQSLSARLSKAGYDFEHIHEGKFDKEVQFIEAISNIDGSGLLFLSDNFLKCTICMNGTMSLLQELIKKDQVLPLILDGRYPNKNGDSDKLVFTEISKVGHILKYMNYWQDRYLELRRLKGRTTLTAKQEAVLPVIKTIASEIVDFLRCVKEQAHVDYPTFKARNFEAFFQRFGDKAAYEKFRKTDKAEPSREVVRRSTPSLPTTAIIAGDTIEPIASKQFNRLNPVEIISITPTPAEETKEKELELVASSTVKDFLGADFIEQVKTNSKEALVPVQKMPSVTTGTPITNKVAIQPALSLQPPASMNVPIVNVVERTRAKRTQIETFSNRIEKVVTKEVAPIIGERNTTPKVEAIPVVRETKQVQTEQVIEPVNQSVPSKYAIAAEEKIMLVMGATSPIGTAIAQFFAAKGYRIILTGNRFSLLFKMKVALEDAYEKGVQLLSFDPYNSYSVEMAMDDLDSAWRNIDVLLNISDFGDTPLLTNKQSSYNQMLHTNIEVMNNLTQKIVPYLKAQKKGNIINIVPIDVADGKGQICKVLTEGVSAFTKTLQLDLRDDNVKVSQLLPEFEGALTEEMGKGIAGVVHFITTQPDNLVVKNVTLTSK